MRNRAFYETTGGSEAHVFAISDLKIALLNSLDFEWEIEFQEVRVNERLGLYVALELSRATSYEVIVSPRLMRQTASISETRWLPQTETDPFWLRTTYHSVRLRTAPFQGRHSDPNSNYSAVGDALTALTIRLNAQLAPYQNRPLDHRGSDPGDVSQHIGR